MNKTERITKAASDLPLETLIVAYHALTITVVGTFFNLLTFIILCRSTFRNVKARPTLHYMRTMAIFDILMFYGWNLSHYTYPIHSYYPLNLNIPICKIVSFLNYVPGQVSAWLRVFVCLDRYLSLSRLQKTWFQNSNHVLMVIGGILAFFTLLNLHFLIFACYYGTYGEIVANSWLFEIYPLWDYVHLGIYNCAPLLLMVVFNSGVIYHLIRLRQTSTVQNSRIHHRAISITLVITTFLFLVMTVPSGVAFSFFYTADRILLEFLDGMLYTYHMLTFLLYFVSWTEFRRECIALITCRKADAQVVPTVVTRMNTVNASRAAVAVTQPIGQHE